MKDLRLFCQPVPVGFKDGPGVWLIVVRCQCGLVSPFLIEIQCVDRRAKGTPLAG